MTKPTALIGIARVSTDGQADARRAGLDRQIEAINQIARNQGVPDSRLTIITLRDVGGSDVGQTPEWRDHVLPRLADPGVHLAVDAVDRIIRPDGFDFGVLATLQTAGTRVYTPGGVADLRTPEGFMATGMRALFGGLEKLEFKRRVHRAREVKRKRGEWCQAAHLLPLGITYDFETQTWDYDGRAGDVKLVFQMVVREGRSFAEAGEAIGYTSAGVRGILGQTLYRGVWRIDEKRGFETVTRKDGRQPTRRKVRRAPEEIIETRVFGGDGQPEQLIDDALWYSAQEIIAKNRKRHRRAKRNSHGHIWASGFLYSAFGDHGHHQFGFDTGPIRVREHVLYGVTRRLGREGNKKTSFWYRCQCLGGSGIEPTCGLPHLPAHEINQAVDRLMLAICRSKKFQRDVIDAAVDAVGGEDHTAEKTRLEEQIKKLEAKRARVLEGYEAGLYSVVEAKKRTEDVRAKVERLTASLAALGRRDPQAEREATRAHFESIEMWSPEWGREQKTAWLKKYIGGVIIGTEGVEGLILRLPRADGSIEAREHYARFGWAELGLEYDPTNREERQAARRADKGVFQTGDIADAIGADQNRVRYLVRTGQIQGPTGKKGRYRVWDQEAFERAVEQGKALA